MVEVVAAMNTRDYYEILTVERNASQRQIKETYRRLAFQYHPDRNKGDARATEQMKEINEAYAVLSDVRKRGEYDALKDRYGSFAYDRFRQAHSSEDIFRGSDVAQVFEELARMFGFRSGDEVFREFYGSGYRGFTFVRPGVAGRGFVFSGSFGGGRYQSEGNRAHSAQDPFSLPGVRFSGILGKLAKFALTKTFGMKFPEKGKDWKDVIAVTPEQAQKGQEVMYSYRKWGKPRDLLVRIPPDVGNGQSIRLSGMGAPGKSGGEPGDLYLRVRIRVPLLQRIRTFFKRFGL